MAIKDYEFWFIVGTQHLYGEEIFADINAHAKEMCDEWSAKLPCKVVAKPCVKTSSEILNVIQEANNTTNCAGIITWMHTFSPSKMWIAGLNALNKPYLHVNTQFNRDIPWDPIDMDFMNLNQSAHGDREHGYIHARMRKKVKVIAGYWKDETFQNKMGVWMRAAVGANESRKLRVLRISDNMRNVAVTDGDKIEAQIKLGWQVDHYGVGDIIKYVNAVSEDEIDAQMDEYKKNYDFDTNNIDSIRYQAREEVAIKKFLDENGFGAFHTNFEDLQELRQLPGLAAQDLMRQGYGFGAEGDWKVAAMVRLMKIMTSGMKDAKGTSKLEDYTYNLVPGKEGILEAHMLEICPSIADGPISIKCQPLSMGDREDPARLVFTSKEGTGIATSLVDLGDRFRLLINTVDCKKVEKPMPKLPVATNFWTPQPDLITGAEAWILAGGAHHTAFTYDLTAEQMGDWAEAMGIEPVYIDNETTIRNLKKDLMLGNLVYRK